MIEHAAGDRPDPTRPPEVHAIDPMQPLVWLRRGWHDLTQAPQLSLGYGALVAVAGMILLALAWGATYLVPALLGGFLLIAPFAAIVFYALSRQIERGDPVDGTAALFAWRRNATSISLWGLSLMLVLLAWERLAAIVFALFYGGDVIDLRTLAIEVLTGQRLGLLVAYVGVGGLLALTVFVFGVVTAPMLLDRDIDMVTAALTSLRCCMRSPGAALLWAALIAGLSLIGFATLMLGLVVLFPWLGHASWHAYRDWVK